MTHCCQVELLVGQLKETRPPVEQQKEDWISSDYFVLTIILIRS